MKHKWLSILIAISVAWSLLPSARLQAENTDVTVQTVYQNDEEVSNRSQ